MITSIAPLRDGTTKIWGELTLSDGQTYSACLDTTDLRLTAAVSLNDGDLVTFLSRDGGETTKVVGSVESRKIRPTGIVRAAK